MGDSIPARFVWAVGAVLVFWLVAFSVRRLLHRRDRVLRSPEQRPWQDDALAALPLAWIFAAREVLRAVMGREPTLALHAAVGIGVAAALFTGMWILRRARPLPPPR